MANEQTSLSRHDLETKIIKRCWEDEAFHKEFTANPTAAFTRYLNIPSSSLPKIYVHEEEPGAWHIVLPSKPANAGELSEADLEKIAGSSVVFVPVSAVVSAIVSGAVGSASITVGTVIVSKEEGGW